MTENVYHARFISEDTNPWDSNESYGVWATLELAQTHAFGTFKPDEENVISWVDHRDSEYERDTYTGWGDVRTWERIEHKPGEDPKDFAGDSYGMFIFEEPLR